MRYRKLGTTSIAVSELGFGCFGIGGSASGNSYGPTDNAESVKAIEVALDLGCTFFDTADIYGLGHSESLLGQTLKSSALGRDAIVATKVGAFFDGSNISKNFGVAHIRASVEASLQRLRRDTIDVYQLHDPPLAVLAQGEAMECLQALVREGKIRSYGASIHSMDEAQAAVNRGRAMVVQAAFSLLCLVEPGNRTTALCDLIEKSGVGLIAREPLASGFLSGRHSVETRYGQGDLRNTWPEARRQAYISLSRTFSACLAPGINPAQAALRFVLDQSFVSTTIVGTKTAEQARINFTAPDLDPFETIIHSGPMDGAEPQRAI